MQLSAVRPLAEERCSTCQHNTAVSAQTRFQLQARDMDPWAEDSANISHLPILLANVCPPQVDWDRKAPHVGEKDNSKEHQAAVLGIRLGFGASKPKANRALQQQSRAVGVAAQEILQNP